MGRTQPYFRWSSERISISQSHRFSPWYAVLANGRTQKSVSVALTSLGSSIEQRYSTTGTKVPFREASSLVNYRVLQ
jgi:hypothetical protein